MTGIRLYAKGIFEKVIGVVVKGFFKFLGFLHLTPMFFVGLIGVILYFTGAFENQIVTIVFDVVLGLTGAYSIVGIIMSLTGKWKKKEGKKRGKVDIVENENGETSGEQVVSQVQPTVQTVNVSPAPPSVRYYEVRQNPSLVMAEYADRYVLYRKTPNGLVKIRTDYKQEI